MNPEAGADGAPDFWMGRGPAAAIVAFLLFTVYTFSVAIVPIRSDNDCWWHVKSGQYIVQNGLPKHDVFSYTAAQDEWHNHEWLAQIAYYGAWRIGEDMGLGGWRGLILFVGGIIWAGYAVLFLLSIRLSRSAWIALLVVVLAVAIGRRTFYPRPPVISNLLLAVQLYLLVGAMEGWFRRRWTALLVPIYAAWVNLHGGWMAGLVLMGAFGADTLWQALRHRLPRIGFWTPPVPFPLPQACLLVGGCVLATLVNPYGWRLYELPVRVLGDRELVRSIGELQPPNLYFVPDFELTLMGLFALALVVRRFRPSIFELLIFFFFLHQAVNHVRHLLLFSVMMVPMASRLVGLGFSELCAAMQARRAEGLRLWHPAIAGAAALLLGLYSAGWVLVNPREGGTVATLFAMDAPPRTYPQRNLQYLSGTGYIRHAFPAAVVDVIELAELEGNMFNENYYAGYLIWRLAPEKHKVFSDPRFDIFGGRIWREEVMIAEGVEEPGMPTWRELLDEHDVQWLIARGEKGLGRRLRNQQQPDWALVAAWPETPQPLDAGWQLWVRNTPDNQPMIGRARDAAALAGAVRQ